MAMTRGLCRGRPRPAVFIRPRKPPLTRFSSSERREIYVQGSSIP